MRRDYNGIEHIFDASISIYGTRAQIRISFQKCIKITKFKRSE